MSALSVHFVQSVLHVGSAGVVTATALVVGAAAFLLSPLPMAEAMPMATAQNMKILVHMLFPPCYRPSVTARAYATTNAPHWLRTPPANQTLANHFVGVW